MSFALCHRHTGIICKLNKIYDINIRSLKNKNQIYKNLNSRDKTIVFRLLNNKNEMPFLLSFQFFYNNEFIFYFIIFVKEPSQPNSLSC